MTRKNKTKENFIDIRKSETTQKKSKYYYVYRITCIHPECRNGLKYYDGQRS